MRPHGFGVPASVPAEYDCAIRRAAWAYGRRTLPAILQRGSFNSLFDALQLQACDEHRPAQDRHAGGDDFAPVPDALPTDQPVLLVEPELASLRPAQQASPNAEISRQERERTFATLHDAVAASRQLRRTRGLAAGAPVTIALRGGTHFLRRTLHLGPIDSGLTLRSYPAEAATLSGGVPLPIASWHRSGRCGTSQAAAPCWQTNLSALKAARELIHGVPGLRHSRRRLVRARYPNADPEQGAHDGETGWVTSPTKWVARGHHRMNGVAGGWPPAEAASVYVVTAADFPEVEWPMSIQEQVGRRTPDSSWDSIRKSPPVDSSSALDAHGETPTAPSDGARGRAGGETPERIHEARGARASHADGPHPQAGPQVDNSSSRSPHTSQGHSGAHRSHSSSSHVSSHADPRQLQQLGHMLGHQEVQVPQAVDVPGHGGAAVARRLTSSASQLIGRGCHLGHGCWTGQGSWGEFWIGVGGTCVDRSPPAGYWCAPGAPRAISTPNHPSGLEVTALQLPHLPYANATGAVVHAWRPGHWYTNAYEVGLATPHEVAGEPHGDDGGDQSARRGVRLEFRRGGTQGAEGATSGDAWFVENVLEELDAPGEWFYDDWQATLYFAPNHTSTTHASVPPPLEGFAATQLQALINVSGDRSSPVSDFRLEGLRFVDSAHTHFAPHGLPSGGDWALPKVAALTVAGTERFAVTRCLFERLDGDALLATGYHRELSVRHSEFRSLGGSAVVLWGDTSECLNHNCSRRLPAGVKMGPDGRGGEQPMGSVLESNLAHEIGLTQKQSAFLSQAVAFRTVVRGNVVFNAPRAAINFNDGFGGGDEVSRNLLLNTCRESSDHGPLNLWDRQPYITTARSGRPSVVPATRHVHHNFVIANYHSQEAVDTDDGAVSNATQANASTPGTGRYCQLRLKPCTTPQPFV